MASDPAPPEDETTEWARIKQQLRPRISPTGFENWLAETRQLGRAESVLRVSVDDEITAAWLREEYGEVINGILPAFDIAQIEYTWISGSGQSKPAGGQISHETNFARESISSTTKNARNSTEKAQVALEFPEEQDWEHREQVHAMRHRNEFWMDFGSATAGSGCAPTESSQDWSEETTETHGNRS